MRNIINTKSKKNGFSLIEMMIAMFIGLFLLTGIATSYLSSKKSSVERNEYSALEDNGRLALEYLAKSMEHVGYAPGRIPPENKFITADSQITAATCDDGTSNIVDQSILTQSGKFRPIGFSYFGDSNLFTDCAGGELPTACRLKPLLQPDPLPNAAKIYNTFYIDYAKRTLMCAGSRSSQPVVIAEGVEYINYIYGIDLNDDDEIRVDRYVPSFLVGTNWNNVVSVQIGVLVRSLKPVKKKNEKKNYTIFNTQYSAPDDKYLRDVFTTTVFLRNNL